MAPMPIEGGCQCEALRFELAAPPLFTHACHCLNCRRRSGSAFALSTTVVLADVRITRGTLASRQISPRTTVHACASCGTTIHSTSTRHPATCVLRGGTLDDPSLVEPGAHIWVKRKHPWIRIPEGVAQFVEDGDLRSCWPRAAIVRMEEAIAALARR